MQTIKEDRRRYIKKWQVGRNTKAAAAAGKTAKQLQKLQRKWKEREGATRENKKGSEKPAKK
jgi:hypothetical protein